MRERYRNMMEQITMSDRARRAVLSGLEQPVRRRNRPLRAVLTAACACLVLMGTAFAVTAFSGVSVSDFFHDGTAEDAAGGEFTYSGYTTRIDTFIPLDSLSGEIRDFAAEQKMNSRYAGSWAEAGELIGVGLIDLTENALLEGASHVGVFEDGRWYNSLIYTASDDGQELYFVQALAFYRIWEEDHSSYVPVRVSANLYTEAAADPETGTYEDGGMFPEDTEYTREDYVTPNGLEAVIIGVDAPWDPTEYAPVYPYIYEAVFAVDQVYYRVQVDFPDPEFAASIHAYAPYTDVETYAPHALEVLKQVLDGFQ